MSREWSKGKKKKEFPIGFEPMTFPMHIPGRLLSPLSYFLISLPSITVYQLSLLITSGNDLLIKSGLDLKDQARFEQMHALRGEISTMSIAGSH